MNPSLNELNQLAAMGITLPSPWYIFWSIVFGIAGLVAFRYGRKYKDQSIKWSGVALMVYPYIVTDDVWMFVVGVGLCGLIFYFYKIN